MATKDIKPSNIVQFPLEKSRMNRIKGAGMDFPTSPETGLTRRQVLGKALGTGAGAVSSIVPDIISGGLVDLVKSSYPPLPSSSISKSLADLVAATQIMEFDTQGTTVEDTIFESDLDMDMDSIVHGDDSYAGQLEEAKEGAEEEAALMDAGHAPVDYEFYEDYNDYYDNRINEVNELESDILDKMTDLKIAFKDKYPDDFVDWLFKSPKGKGILNGARKAIDEIYFRPGQAGVSPGATEFLEEDNSAIEEIETGILPELLQTAVKQFEIEKEEWKKIVDKVYKPDLKDLPEESSLEDIATIPTFRILRKALGKLGAPKPEAIEGPKPEAPKQIEGPRKSPVQMANIASALSRFKRATPLGAAASMYPISPAGVGSDVIRPYNIRP